MITDQDIAKLKKTFATKEELADLKLEFADLRDTVTEKMDGIDTKLDRFLGKLDAVEIDNKAGAAVLYRYGMNFTMLAKHLGIILPT